MAHLGAPPCPMPRGQVQQPLLEPRVRPLKKKGGGLARWLGWVSSRTPKVVGSMPSQGTDRRQPIDDVSFPLSPLPFSLKSMNISSSGDLKKKERVQRS